VGNRKPQRLFTTELDVSLESANKLKEPGLGLYFDWGPDAACYQSHVREKPKADLPKLLRDLLENQKGATEDPSDQSDDED
jgi:hypothetical protein